MSVYTTRKRTKHKNTRSPPFLYDTKMSAGGYWARKALILRLIFLSRAKRGDHVIYHAPGASGDQRVNEVQQTFYRLPVWESPSWHFRSRWRYDQRREVCPQCTSVYRRNNQCDFQTPHTMARSWPRLKIARLVLEFKCKALPRASEWHTHLLYILPLFVYFQTFINYSPFPVININPSLTIFHCEVIIRWSEGKAPEKTHLMTWDRCSGVRVVSTSVSHQCGPGSIPGRGSNSGEKVLSELPSVPGWGR